MHPPIGFLPVFAPVVFMGCLPLGRVHSVSNPYRVNYQAGGNDGLGYQTTTTCDALGRVVRVEMADGATVTSYAGNEATVTDAAGKRRSYRYDALGRLTMVVEDPGGMNATTKNRVTTYTYGVLDVLASVMKGGQLLQSGRAMPGAEVRTFNYDSLGRLQNSTQPESGFTSYEYYTNGNLRVRTDSRGVQTIYEYDGLNRLTKKTYSDGTPEVTYCYNDTEVAYCQDDTGVAYGKGRLAKITNGNSTTNYLNYDALGRVVQSSQVTGGQTYTFGYTYDLLGSLKTETYPSGRVVTTQYNKAERVSNISGSLNGIVSSYVSGMSYAPHGGFTGYTMGNQVQRTFEYTSRLQMASAQDSLNGPTLLQLTNGWRDARGMANNGNLYSQTITGGGLTFKQHFGYDAVNRLSTAQELSTAPPEEIAG